MEEFDSGFAPTRRRKRRMPVTTRAAGEVLEEIGESRRLAGGRRDASWLLPRERAGCGDVCRCWPLMCAACKRTLGAGLSRSGAAAGPERGWGGLVKGIRPSQWMHGLDGGVAGLLGLPRDLCAGEKGSGLVKNVGVRRSYRRRCWPGCAVRRLVGTHAGAWSGAHDQWAVLDG